MENTNNTNNNTNATSTTTTATTTTNRTSNNNVNNNSNNESTSGDNRPPELRRRFSSRQEASDAVKLYVFNQNKALQVDKHKSGGKSIVMRCAEVLKKRKDDDNNGGGVCNCPTYVRISKAQHNDTWSVSAKSLNLNHDVNCQGTQKMTAKMLAASAAVRSAVDSNPNIAQNELSSLIQSHSSSSRRSDGDGDGAPGMNEDESGLNFNIGSDGVLNCSKAMMYRARDIAKSNTEKEAAKDYYKLESFASEFQKLNPQSSCFIEWNEESNEFERLFYMNGSLKKIIEHSAHPFDITECTSVKSPSLYSGKMLSLVTLDGNLDVMPVAFALVPEENEENYRWFYKSIQECLWNQLSARLNDTNYVHHFSDFIMNHNNNENEENNNNGVLGALETSFPQSHKFHCFQKILSNIHAKMKHNMRDVTDEDLQSIQECSSSTEFQSKMQNLSQQNEELAQELTAISGDWAVYKFIEDRVPLFYEQHKQKRKDTIFGDNNNNIIETFNNGMFCSLLQLEPLEFLKEVCNLTLDLNNKGRDNVKTFEASNMVLTEAVKKNLLNTEIFLELEQHTFSTRKINDFCAIVSEPGGGKEHKVVFGNRCGTCTCGEWEQSQSPCIHALVARKELKFKVSPTITSTEGEVDVMHQEWYEYAYSPIYLVKNYKKAYEMNDDIDPPLNDDIVFEDESTVTRLPPKKRSFHRVGPPTKKRKRRRTQAANGGPIRVYKCKQCGSTEHNIRRCPELHTC